MGSSKRSGRRSGARRSGNPARAAAGSTGRPASDSPARPLGPRPQRAPAGPTSDARRALERRSAPLLLRLNRLPRLVVPIVLGLLLVAGLLVPNGVVGALLLLVIVAFLGWLLALSWPLLATSARLIRVVTVAAIAGLAVVRALGRL